MGYMLPFLEDTELDISFRMTLIFWVLNRTQLFIYIQHENWWVSTGNILYKFTGGQGFQSLDSSLEINLFYSCEYGMNNVVYLLNTSYQYGMCRILNTIVYALSHLSIMQMVYTIGE